MEPSSSSCAAGLGRFGSATEFVVGANLPWITYGTDFGASAWHPGGGLGVQSPARERLYGAFAALERDGISVVRVFLLCDGRSGITYDANGLPTGLDDSFFPDVDELLTAARAHDLRVMPTLLDFHLCGPLRLVDGVQLGGRAHLVEPEGRRALIDRVLTPIFERYGENGHVEAWDVMNEPEWCLRGSRAPGWPGIDLLTMQEFLREAVQCAHASGRQPVTVGCAGTWRLDLVRPLGLDFYQVHWYERFGWSVLERPVGELGLDRPVILGEFPGAHGRRGASEVLDAAKRAGYRGAFVWSVLSDDPQSGYPRDVVAWMREPRRPSKA